MGTAANHAREHIEQTWDRGKCKRDVETQPQRSRPQGSTQQLETRAPHRHRLAGSYHTCDWLTMGDLKGITSACRITARALTAEERITRSSGVREKLALHTAINSNTNTEQDH